MDRIDGGNYPRSAAPPAAGRGLAQPVGQQPAAVDGASRRRERSPGAEALADADAELARERAQRRARDTAAAADLAALRAPLMPAVPAGTLSVAAERSVENMAAALAERVVERVALLRRTLLPLSSVVSAAVRVEVAPLYGHLAAITSADAARRLMPAAPPPPAPPPPLPPPPPPAPTPSILDGPQAIVQRLGWQGWFRWPVLAENLETVFPRETLRSLHVATANGLNQGVQHAASTTQPQRRRRYCTDAELQHRLATTPWASQGTWERISKEIEDFNVLTVCRDLDHTYRVDELYREFWADVRRQGVPNGWVPWTANGISLTQMRFFLLSLTVGGTGDDVDSTLIAGTGFSKLREVITGLVDLHTLRGLPTPRDDTLCSTFRIRY